MGREPLDDRLRPSGRPSPRSSIVRWSRANGSSTPDHDVADAVAELDDPEASADALRHVLVGGVNSVQDFADEVVEAEGGEAITAHQASKVIGEILAELE